MPTQPVITSLQNPFFRYCLKLRENRKRRRLGQFLIDGTPEICRAIRAGILLEKLLVSSQHPLPGQLIEALQQVSPIAIQAFEPFLMTKLCYGQVETGPVAIAMEPRRALASMVLAPKGTVLVLDRVEKPGNFGACVRSAAASGVSAILLTRPICDPYNSNAIRASRGSVFEVPLAEASPTEVMELANRMGLPVFAARVAAGRCLWDLPLAMGGFIVFGNETHGLDDCWQGPSVLDFEIPMRGGVDSLNLSISAALTMYEALRQKQRPQFDPAAVGV